jgi:NAD(P) transhydrogenase subunit alpha
MRVAVLKESAPGERRVALAPDDVARLVKDGHQVQVERGAGAPAGFTDEAYAAAGARLGTGLEALEVVEVLAVVQRPTPERAERLPPGALLVGLLQPDRSRPFLERLAARGVAALAMERVPRTTRAQAMDALSSQASLAGYKAVLIGAAALPRVLPMMTTAAGTLAPARVFVIGAGVAGLQALATARRLGAITSAFDVRPEVKEQVESVGAAFVEIAASLKSADLVICTAAVPGKPAPRLLDAAAVASMRPGSVIVDLAAETGGNCELTRPGETVVSGGVTILGPVLLAATLPFHASQQYGRNLLALLRHLAPAGGAIRLDAADEITGAMLVVHEGKVR